MPERTAVFTVRLAPSLVAGLRRHARSRGLTPSAAVAEAARLYLDARPTSDAVAARVEIEFVGRSARQRAAGAGVRFRGARAAPSDNQRSEL